MSALGRAAKHSARHHPWTHTPRDWNPLVSAIPSNLVSVPNEAAVLGCLITVLNEWILELESNDEKTWKNQDLVILGACQHNHDSIVDTGCTIPRCPWLQRLNPARVRRRNHGKGAVRVAMACPELKGSSRTKARPLGTARQDARPGSCAVLPHDHSPM